MLQLLDHIIGDDVEKAIKMNGAFGAWGEYCKSTFIWPAILGQNNLIGKLIKYKYLKLQL